MNFIENIIIKTSKFFTAFGIAGGVALAFVNVVARYIFESSFTWAGELTIYLFLWSTFFGAVYCFKKGAHIAVDVFLVKASPKIAKFLTILTQLIALIYVGAIAFYGYKYVLLYMDLGEMSVDLNIPLWIPYVVVPISFAFSAIVLIYKIVATFKTPAEQLHSKSEAQQVLEEMGMEKLVKEVERKTGGML